MTGDAILFISDVHTHYKVINEQIVHAQSNGHNLSRVVVLGDFGFFGSPLHDFFRRKGNLFFRPVSFIDGNHEDHGSLQDLAHQYSDVVEYLPRSSILQCGSLSGLCLGGVQYMDAGSTPMGCEVTPANIEACLARDAGSVDFILSHDCPADIGMPSTPGMEFYGTPGVPAFSELSDFFKPRLWIFGHHHQWFDEQLKETRYIGLPESWVGYVLMNSEGEIQMVKHQVEIEEQPWWRRWFGVG